MSDPLLQVRDLRVRFGHGEGGSQVVHGVDFAVGRGEKLALVGESGSGKSVTALSVMRLHDPGKVEYPSGEIRFDGRELLGLPESLMRGLRGREIGMIFQEPMTSLNPVQPVGRQIAETLVLHEGMGKTAARRRAVELLELTGIPEPGRRVDAFPHMLSGGQRQRAMIALALACRPKLLIADEPTTALDVTIEAQILDLLDSLQAEFGMSILMITHDLNLVRRFADRVCVMQAGELVEQGEVAGLFRRPGHPYTRQLLASTPERMITDDRPPAGEPLLEGRALNCHFPVRRGGLVRRRVGEVRAVDDVDLAVAPGETLGIVGESGSGKTTLGMCLLRLQACRGEIRLAGESLTGLRGRALRRQRRYLQVVFQDPFSSLSPRMTVESIVGEGLRVHHPEMDREQRRASIAEMLAEVGLEPAMMERYPHEFSGGQRQRIAIARAVILRPRLVLLDEPTSALDVTVQKQVLALLHDLQQRHGLSYLFISHDLRVVRAVSHRVLVMKDGRVVESGTTEELFTAPEHPYTRRLLEAAAVEDPA